MLFILDNGTIDYFEDLQVSSKFVDEIRKIAWLRSDERAFEYRDSAIVDDERADMKTFGAGKSLRDTKQRLLQIRDDGEAADAKVSALRFIFMSLRVS